ncbi:MAG: nucleotide exchange factor GrpE [Myxococcota bacterium]
MKDHKKVDPQTYTTEIPADLAADLESLQAGVPAPEAVVEMDVEPPPVEPPDNTKLLKEIEDLKAQNARLEDKSLRIAADFENYRKRTAREKEEFFKFAAEGVMREFLDVADNMEQALAHMDTTDNLQALKTGVELTFKSFLDALKKKGAYPFDSLGKGFDPSLHEAVQTLPSDTVPSGCISAEIRKGYMLHDRLLRPAMVVVSTGVPEV